MKRILTLTTIFFFLLTTSQAITINRLRTHTTFKAEEAGSIFLFPNCKASDVAVSMGPALNFLWIVGTTSRIPNLSNNIFIYATSLQIWIPLGPSGFPVREKISKEALRVALDFRGLSWQISYGNVISQYTAALPTGIEVLPGQGKEIAVGGATPDTNTVYVIAPGEGARTVYKWLDASRTWQIQDIQAVKIAVRPDGSLAYIDANGAVWVVEGGQSQALRAATTITAKDLTVGGDGQIYIVSDIRQGLGYLTYKYNQARSDWTLLKDVQAETIAALSNGTLYFTDSAYNLYGFIPATAPPPPAVVTQAELLATVYTAGPYRSASSKTRSFTVSVTFPKPFDEVPSVGLVLAGYDTWMNQWNFDISAQNITTTGFDINVTTYPYSVTYNFQVSYIATLTKYSGIHIAESSLNNQESDVAAVANVAGERDLQRKFADPIKDMQVMAFFRGIGVLKSNVISLSVQADTDGMVTYSLLNDTKFIRASSTIIYWDQSKKDVYTTQLSTGLNTVLSRGYGNRNLDVAYKPGHLQNPQQLLGVCYVSYSPRNTRLIQVLNPTNVTFKVWSDTGLIEVRDNLFSTCEDSTGDCVLSKD